MKYLVRAIKYFFYLLIILTLVILLLVAFKIVEGNISTMFVNGYDSLWQIALIAFLFSLIYPRVNYTTRKAYMTGEPERVAQVAREVMAARGYVVETTDGDDMTFRKKSAFTRAIKMWEDRLTFSKIPTGYNIEGHTRELVRVISALEARNEEEEA